ncbi:MAG TPA: Fe-S cluster assembly protein SufD [Bacteroidales bacterium]|nr:Fe-S cluster assembly protein SufD [Bacteroidales bacterium]
MDTLSNTNYTDLFLQYKDIFLDNVPGFVRSIREQSAEKFSQAGFPAKKNEMYKYTFLEPYFNNGYKKHIVPKPITFNINDMFRCDVPYLDTHVAIILNGFYYDTQNPLVTLPGGIIMGSLAEAIRQYPALVEAHLSKYVTTDDSYVSLNSAMARDGVFLYVPEGRTLDKPIQIINILLADEELMVQHRNLFILGEGSAAKVVICDHTLNQNKYLTNSVFECFVGKNASFECFRTQNEHNDSANVAHVFIHQEEASNALFNSITLHGGLIRNNLYVTLAGEHCDNSSLGLLLADSKQHVDNYTFIDHAVPNCTSNQLYKSVLDDQATGVFTGKILVRKDAQKTLAYQRNSNLLLTNEARANGKPQLEIYADDVKCSHGATVGQIDENALFYLRSRGISEREARLLLMYAFAYEVIKKIQVEPLQLRIGELVDKRLRGELSQCNNCAMHCK